ncbi:MAG: shikimate dehydrogenase [Beutenbergiaceae bacterium]
MAEWHGARRAAVLGHPVAHSLSPVLHRRAYRALELTDWRYELHDVDEPDLDRFLDQMDQSWVGLSLTMPLKRRALQLVDVVQPLAQVTGAVNTIVFQPGGLSVGANTDVYGLVAALAEATPQGVAPGMDVPRVVIVGGGATAASALAAAGELGNHRPVVLVRNPGRAGAVIRAAAAMGVEPQFLRLGTAPAREAMVSANVVMSTVPGAASAALADLLRGTRLEARQVLLDVVYQDWPTAVGRAWQQAGGSVAPGHLMLLHQACEQVRLMTGQPAPVTQMRAALLEAIGA